MSLISPVLVSRVLWSPLVTMSVRSEAARTDPARGVGAPVSPHPGQVSPGLGARQQTVSDCQTGLYTSRYTGR